MKVTIGSDHGAVDLKEAIKEHLKGDSAIELKDVGTHGAASVDYPDYAALVCADVTQGAADLGIVLCGTGIGVSISANKIRGIRCALCSETYSAKKAREHNDANVLAIGGRTTGPGLAAEIVDAFLHTDFSGAERHERRIQKMMALENKE